MTTFLAILWKDLLSEWRSRDRLVAMGLFSVLVVLVLRFALSAAEPSETRRLAPGLLWVTYVFAAILGLNRAFAIELENEALSGLALAPADRGFVFLGKATANFVLLGVVEAVTAVVFGVAFALDLWPVAAPLAGVVALGSAGLCTVGTLFSAVAVRTRYREVMLPLLVLPLLVPVLLGAVGATASLLAEGRAAASQVQLLVVTDGVFLIVSFLGFEYVLDE
jgi:heme exporter protein B